jgi:5-methylcytosine-specific restriction endonuclease McrA
MYEKAKRMTQETGIQHDVDHIVPLSGKLVSGLHTHDNLQVITSAENKRKAAKFNYQVA